MLLQLGVLFFKWFVFSDGKRRYAEVSYGNGYCPQRRVVACAHKQAEREDEVPSGGFLLYCEAGHKKVVKECFHRCNGLSLCVFIKNSFTTSERSNWCDFSPSFITASRPALM